MSTKRPRQQDTPGDQIHANVGEGACGVAVGKNIIQIGSIVMPIWLAGSIALLLLLSVTGTGYGLYQNSRPTATPFPMATPTVTPPPTATQLATATEAPGETLILIAPFYHSGDNVVAHRKIERALSQALQRYPELNLRVAVDDRLVLNADQRAEAEALAKRYNASMVIWGEDTGTEMRVNLLNLRAVAFADREPQIVEREDVQLKRSDDGYSHFVNEGLPNQMTFLALVTIAEAQLMAPDFETQQQTRETLQAALALNPVDEPLVGAADAYFTLGWFTFYYAMDYPAAIDAFTHVVTLEPTNADAHFNLAEIYDIEGHYEKALDHFTQSIEAAPRSNAWAYDGRAMLYMLYEEYQSAFDDYTTFIELEPENPYGYAKRSHLAETLGDWDGALADIERVIELAPEQAHHYESRAHIRLQQGDWQAAVADIERAMALNPAMLPHFQYQRGAAYAAGEAWDAALADFTEALRLAPTDRFAYLARAQIYIKQQAYIAALADLDQALTIPGRREVFQAYYERGRVHYHLGNRSQALADLQAYLDGQPDGEFAVEAAALIKEIEQNS